MAQTQQNQEFHVIGGGKIAESLGFRAYTCEELAEIFDVGKRTIQTRFSRVLEAYPWLEISTLRTGESKHTRYTSLSLELLQELQNRSETMSESQWINQVHSDNSDLYQQWLSSQNPAPQPTPQPTEQQPGVLALSSSAWLTDESLDDLDSDLEILQTSSFGRSDTRDQLSSRISILALKGYKHGQVEILEEEDELARIYEAEAEAEIDRIEKEQRVAAIRRKARKDVQTLYGSSVDMGKQQNSSDSMVQPS